MSVNLAASRPLLVFRAAASSVSAQRTTRPATLIDLLRRTLEANAYDNVGSGSPVKILSMRLAFPQ